MITPEIYALYIAPLLLLAVGAALFIGAKIVNARAEREIAALTEIERKRAKSATSVPSLGVG